MDKIIPPKLKLGDTIAIISPSSGLAALFPHRLDNAIKYLKLKGYKIKEFSCTRKIDGWESASPAERARNIMDAFTDPEITAIICTIGGEVANQTLKYLDFEKVKENPKIFCGYSDITVIHYALYTKANLMTYYGPCAMTQFGESPKPLSYTTDYFFKAVSSVNPIGIIKPSKEWTEEILDWSKKIGLNRSRKMISNPGFEWLRKGKAKGEIIGGCISSISHLKGTEYWPNHKGKILFWEIPEGQNFDEGEPISTVDALLEDLELIGVFKEISAMIVGRPFHYNEEGTKKLKKIILERTTDYDFPILYGADIGHTDPQITIPFGGIAKIDSSENLFEILT